MTSAPALDRPDVQCAQTASPAAAVSVGIDLGTTRTVVALADRGNYPVVSFTDSEGDDHAYLPSLTALTDDGLVHGFQAAEAARRGAPLLRSLKRVLAAPQTTWDTPVRLGEACFAVGEVLTGFLAHLRSELETAPQLAGTDLGSPQAAVAVAVPAHAWGSQRMLTLDAFAAAGFHVTAMLNEPSAAGFEYTHRQGRTVSSRRTRVLVYDLGGGTFDTSLVDVSGRRHEVLASRGLADLGGDDVDLVLAHLALAEAGVSEADLTGRQVDDLLLECQRAKEALTPQTRRLVVEVAGRPVVVAAADLYEACAPLVERSVDLMRPLARQLDEVAGIYLVGGASAFPPVGRALRAEYGRRVHRSPYPGSSTAIGLAIAADPGSGYALTDRLSRGLGVFREDQCGTRTSFDPLLDADAVQAPCLGDGVATVAERTYRAAHDLGRYRFVEYTALGADGEPTGQIAPYAQVFFPLTPALRDLSEAGLAEHRVQRLDGPGTLVRERYEVDATGRVQVTLADLSDGFTRTFTLGLRR